MIARPTYFALLPLLVAACRNAPRAGVDAMAPADLVLRNGAVYTVDAARSWATAIAIRGGRVVYVGNDSLPAGLVGSRTEVVDLAGRMVLPGFQDAHVHPVSSGIELGECDINAAATRVQATDSIRACARARPDLAWIRGAGWQLPLFPDGNPSKRLLDSLVPDRPALMWAADGHSAWLNSRALAAANITRETPDPPGGRIERDQHTGEPSGTLRETATALAERVLPPRAPVEYAQGLSRAQRLAASFGITSLFAANADEAELRAFVDADRAGRLDLRVVAALVAPGHGDTMLARLRDWRARYATRRVRPIAVKLFQDGVIEARTAAMLAPYLDRRGDAGTPLRQQAALDTLVAALDRDGFQIHVHAIGDRAIRMTLDAVEHARASNPPRDSRHAIAHLELVDSTDVPRFRRLGVVANFEPLWANGDEYLTRMTEPALGRARSRWLYPIATLVRSGAIVSAGSDWSVSSLNPLDAIETGITHRDPGDSTATPWHPGERVDLPTMIALYTINAAWALHQDRETGSIERGKLADLVVLDRNLFEIPVEHIHTARVVRTLVEGKTVFSR
ncbi:MAG TPA: amidohydrolase family protein [Gemmatimonadales bacterium]|nr:amidohydrolase family protein [Gemmatimonadales bacterium]